MKAEVDLRPGALSSLRTPPCAKEAGIQKRVYPHLLRHTMATRIVNQSMPIEHVRKVLGHESIDTTRVYAETATESLKCELRVEENPRLQAVSAY